MKQRFVPLFLYGSKSGGMDASKKRTKRKILVRLILVRCAENQLKLAQAR